MAEFVVFDELKQRVSIVDVLRHYGILDSLRSRKGGDELVGKCPWHTSSSSDPFRVSVSKNAFHCFGCNAQGNVIGLVETQEELSTREAALLLQGWFPGAPGGSQSRPVPQDISSEPVEINPPLQAPAFPLKNLNPKHPYLKERGLTQETIEHFGLGSASRGLMQGRIAIPIHNEIGDGELVAYAGRWIGEGEPPEGEPRYKLPMGFVKTAVVFNLHRAKKMAREKGELVVTEGYFTVFRLFQCGIENAVALMGAHLAERQMELLVETLGPQGRVVLLFDDDKAGQTASVQAAGELVDKLFVKVAKLPDGAIQPDELSDEDLQRIVAG